MSLGSLLAGSEPLLSPGAEAVVSVGVATLWNGPDRVRAVDEPAVWVPARPRDWVEAMSPEDRADLRGRVASQLLLGERVVVRALHGDWAQVVALGQPTSLDATGYPGTVSGTHGTGHSDIGAPPQRDDRAVLDLVQPLGVQFGIPSS